MLEAGDIVGGDFEILRPLSHGGMGAVFLAHQRSTDATRVVKVMLTDWVRSVELRERFEREARASGRIASEHVVKTIGYGVDARRGVPWMAMEYLPGATLDTRLAEFGVPDKGTAFELLRQLFHGVAAAHSAGVVHRDLKPENIYVAEAQRADVPFTVKVLDFGIAKLLERERPGTRAMGTRAWMAPEQERADAAIQPSADVWALGLIVFWLITGRIFWRHAGDTESMLSYEVHFEATPPASARAHEYGLPLASEAFDAWFAHSVTRDPNARFRDARASWEALSGVFRMLPAWRGFAPGGRGATVELPPLTTAVERESYWPARLSATQTDRSLAAHARAASRISKTTTAPASFDTPTRTAPPASRAPGKLGLVALGAALSAGALIATQRLALEPQRTPPPLSASAAPLLAGSATGAAVVPSSAPAPSASATERQAANAPVPPPGMVYVPPGTFTMGKGATPPHGPEHEVRLTRGYFLDRHETSVGEYRECLRAKRCTPSGVHGPRPTPEEIEQYNGFCTGIQPGGDMLPISCIDYEQAKAYCAFRKKRLPTEAEWEYAARGTDARLYPWGNDPPENCDMAVCSGLCAANGLRNVGLRVPSSASPFGAFDMAGNAWEWVEDTYDPQAYTLTAHDDPLMRGLSQRGVLRGGSWDFVRTRAETSYRQAFDQREGHVSTGVRCALGAEPAASSAEKPTAR
jgi:eukaryotic-like serine/threonine-protein kinase